MKKQLIGIAGCAGSGKDTVADYLVDEMPGLRKDSFAAPLKAMLQIGLHLTHSQTDGNNKEVIDERYGCTPRHMMQTLGTEWGRDCVVFDLWARVLLARYLESSGAVVISDVRFENEATMVRQHGRLIHITGRNTSTNATNHPSESWVKLDTANDLVVRNSGSLLHLYNKLEGLIVEHLIR